MAGLLRTSFEGLKDHLAPRPVTPVSRERLLKRAGAWGIPVSVYERRFRDFCRLQSVKANAKGLRQFEANLQANSEARGGPTKYRELLLQDPFLDEGRGED